ncbi:hypothetical protein HDZ31DRAFT_32257 [Schizophyllum fasciatum]
MSSNGQPEQSKSAVPASLYEGLMPKLANVLELSQRPEGTTTTAAKRAILDATNDFKLTLSRAKEFAVTLPGGESVVEDQDQVLSMLTQLRDRKREQLAQFSARSSTTSQYTTLMNLDSTASTPGL